MKKTQTPDSKSLGQMWDSMVRIRGQRLKGKIAVVTTFLVVSAAMAGATPEAAWNPTGSMAVGRFSFTVTTLRNELVLVAGGTTPGEVITNTAELYNPATGVFTPTGNMNQRRVAFSATPLPGGKVLVEGGASDTDFATNTAEIYDPTTGKWSVTGSMKQGRQQQSAVLLRDGTVLVTGGNAGRTPWRGHLRHDSCRFGVIQPCDRPVEDCRRDDDPAIVLHHHSSCERQSAGRGRSRSRRP